MNRFEYKAFLIAKDAASVKHQQLMRDSKVGTLDLSKYKSKIPTKLEFSSEEARLEAVDTLSFDELRQLVNDNHNKQKDN